MAHSNNIAMKKILVPTDFSETAEHALHIAMDFAKAKDYAILLLHVAYPTQGVDNNVYDMFWDSYSNERKEILEKMAALHSKRAGFANVPISTMVEVGFPTETIQSVAKEQGVDLIIMGSKGNTNLQSSFFGGIALSTALYGSIPVFIVPQNVQIKSFANFALATDLELKLNKNAIQTLKDVLSVHHNTLKVVHVLTEPDAEAAPSKVAHLHQLLAGIETDIHYLHDVSMPDAVRNFVDSIDATGLVVVSHEHGFWHKIFFPSNTKSLISMINLPVLVLHG